VIGEGVSEALRAALHREGLDRVEGAFAYAGGDELRKAGLGSRRRTRVELTDDDGRTHVLYLKRYGHQAVTTAARRWLAHGWPRSPARIEFDNIRAARAAGLPTMREVLGGEEPCPLGCRRSYLLVTAVPGDALERCFESYLRARAPEEVAGVTRRLARLVRTLHDAGYVHRDLYASHVFLDDAAGAPGLHLIDLARMFAPRFRRFRWYVKDIAQLKYSMLPAWVEGCWAAFLAEYLLGVDAEGRRRFDLAVDRKVASMRRRTERRRRRAAGHGDERPR
jgi:tRNA A-37 threonylcarbamoyl transferase component Bud32